MLYFTFQDYFVTANLYFLIPSVFSSSPSTPFSFSLFSVSMRLFGSHDGPRGYYVYTSFIDGLAL